jgi:hypothetical protein
MISSMQWHAACYCSVKVNKCKSATPFVGTPTSGGWARQGERASLACPRQTGTSNQRPADFWREGNSNPFHHGSLLTKIRPVGLLSAISQPTVRLKILRI